MFVQSKKKKKNAPARCRCSLRDKEAARRASVSSRAKERNEKVWKKKKVDVIERDSGEREKMNRENTCYGGGKAVAPGARNGQESSEKWGFEK